MTLLPKVSLKPIILIALMAGLTITLSWKSYRSGYHTAEQKWLTKWSQRDTHDAILARQRESAAREEEKRLQQIMQKEALDAQKKRVTIENDAHRASDAIKRMQHILHQQQRLSGDCRSPAGSERPAADRWQSVLAELLSESIEENRRLARQADRARVAGQACERAYKATTNTQ